MRSKFLLFNRSLFRGFRECAGLLAAGCWLIETIIIYSVLYGVFFGLHLQGTRAVAAAAAPHKVNYTHMLCDHREGCMMITIT